MSEESGGGEQQVSWTPEERFILFALEERYHNNPFEGPIYPRARDDAKPRLERLEADIRYQERAEAYRRQCDEQEQREAEQRWAAQGHTENGETGQPRPTLDDLSDAGRYLFYFCMKVIIGSDDLADDGEATLNSDAQSLARAEQDAWTQREAARFVAAAELIFDWTSLRSRIETEGSVGSGAPDGPPFPDSNDAA